MQKTTNAQPVLTLARAGELTTDDVLRSLRTSKSGREFAEAKGRLAGVGPDTLYSHGARPFAVLLRQLRNPLLILLVGAACVSLVVGERTDASIILAIILLSVGLGFVNEYRSERAVEALHDRVRHNAVVVRNGKQASVDVTELVAGDIVRLDVGDVVPADLRLHG